MPHRRLFIPGPTEVRPEILQAMATPQIGHRAPEISDLYNEIQPKLQKLLYTDGVVLLISSSSTGAMEASVLNTVAKKCVNFTNGAFSERWHKITKANAIPCEAVSVEWGKAIKPELVDEHLSGGDYDAMTLVLNETSTGVMSAIEEIAEVMKKYPDVMFLVDAVSAMAGAKIEVEKLGIDVCLAGVQKAFAMPSGMTVCYVSDKTIKKAEKVERRGFYFDFLTYLKSHQKGQHPSTSPIAHMYALNKQLDDILEEGLENRWNRHKKMAKVTQDWANKYFETYAEPGYESVTLTTIKNTREISVGDLNKELAKHWIMISNGYGDIKNITFRIAHMGDTQLWELYGLLKLIEEILGL